MRLTKSSHRNLLTMTACAAVGQSRYISRAMRSSLRFCIAKRSLWPYQACCQTPVTGAALHDEEFQLHEPHQAAIFVVRYCQVNRGTQFIQGQDGEYRAIRCRTTSRLTVIT